MPNYIFRIKQLREKNGVTQKELANALNVTQTAITYWETGKREPSAEIIEKIADFFNVTPAYIMGWEKPKSEGYYLNEKTANLAQEMFEDEDMRSLFDMKRNMPPERFQAHIEFMRNLYQQEKGQSDKFVKEKQEVIEPLEFINKKETEKSAHDLTKAIAAHNDHASEPDEFEKMMEDIKTLKKLPQE